MKTAIVGIILFSSVFVVTGEVGKFFFYSAQSALLLLLITLWSEVLASHVIMCKNFIVILHDLNWSDKFLCT